MSIAEFDAEVAAATGDTVGTIRRCGFSMLTQEPVELEPDDVPSTSGYRLGQCRPLSPGSFY